MSVKVIAAGYRRHEPIAKHLHHLSAVALRKTERPLTSIEERQRLVEVEYFGDWGRARTDAGTSDGGTRRR